MVNLGAQKLALFRGDVSMEAAGASIDVGRMTWHGWEHGNRIPSKGLMRKLVALVPDLSAGDFYADPDPALAAKLAAASNLQRSEAA